MGRMTWKPRYATMVDVYQQSVTQFASRPLFGTKRGSSWNWTTYREFSVGVDRVRAALQAAGVVAQDRVAMISNNRPEWAMVAFASFGLKAVFVPMYEAQHESEWAYILRDCTAKVVVVPNASVAERIARASQEFVAPIEIVQLCDEPASAHPAHPARVCSWETWLAAGAEHPAAMEQPAPDDLAGLIYTSGTTGNPKGVMLSHLNFASNVSAFQEIFPIDASDRTLSFLPWAHAFGQTAELYLMFSVGASMAIAESVDRIVANLAEVRPTILIAVPRIFNRIYDGVHKRMNDEGGLKKKLFDAAIANEAARSERRSWSSDLKHKVFDKLVFEKVRGRFGGRLRFAVTGGAAIARDVANFIDYLGIAVYEGYGLTEAAPVVATNVPGARTVGSVGRPIPGVRVEIQDGEVVVFGPNVMKGYYKLPDENAAVFTPHGGLRTGDMGRVDERGYLYITGRIKEQYKLENGKYVVPSVLEEQLKLSPFILNACLYGDNRPYNVAVIVADIEAVRSWAAAHGVSASSDIELLQAPSVREMIDEQVKSYSSQFKLFEKVRKFVLTADDFTVQNGMLTPSLKVRRKAVVSHYESQIHQLYP
jgi:long-chain acyl-CoA synthetase